MLSQLEKAQRFRELHTRPGAFAIPNPWDVGSARLLVGLGFRALATTSSGFARSRGIRDYQPGRDNVLRHVAELTTAVDVPISGDLENGFGDTPEACAQTITFAAGVGLVGGSIEDSTGKKDAPQYELAKARERVRAAAEAGRALPFPFTLTARAENYLVGNPDLRDTIARLQAYQEAGADVLYAPMLRTEDDIRTVLREIDRPLNVLLGPRGFGLTIAQLGELGVKRVSVGGALASAATSAFLRAARELHDAGSFGWTKALLPSAEIDELIANGTPK